MRTRDVHLVCLLLLILERNRIVPLVTGVVGADVAVCVHYSHIEYVPTDTEQTGALEKRHTCDQTMGPDKNK